MWIGHDHRRLRAATAGLHRVRVEVTVLGGGFRDAELVSLFEGLKPADEARARELRALPFAILSYQHRHRRTASDVPLSYWRHLRDPRHLHRARAAGAAALADLPVRAPALDALGYSLDSVYLVGPEGAEPAEVDFVYEARGRGGAGLRVLISPPGSPHPIPYPPERSTQECRTDTGEREGHTAHRAWLTEDYGPHEACLRHRAGTVLVLAQPARWTDAAWFEKVIGQVLRTL